MNEELKDKQLEFINSLKNKNDFDKSLFHYYSVINLSNCIANHWDEKAKYLKKLLISYFEFAKESNYFIEGKLESSKLHTQYILPVKQYLIKKDNFVTNNALHVYTILGVLIDVTVSYFFKNYYYPIFTIILISTGYYLRYQAKKNNKYARLFW